MWKNRPFSLCSCHVQYIGLAMRHSCATRTGGIVNLSGAADPTQKPAPRGQDAVPIFFWLRCVCRRDCAQRTAPNRRSATPFAFFFGRVACAPVIAHSPEPGTGTTFDLFWLRCVRLRGWAQRIAMNRRRAATFAATCGRPSQELAGGQPNIWRRFGEELAGGQPKNWRATNPRTGGRPTQELASDNSAGMRLAWTPHNSPRLWAESR